MAKISRQEIYHVVCSLLNWSPIFHISCDDKFGQYVRTAPTRYSLFAMAIGGLKIYFLTMSANHINFLFTLRLRDISSPPDQNTVDAKATAYRNDISTQSDAEIAIQYDFLKEAYNNNCNTRSSLETKVSSHASTYLVLIGFYAYVFNELWKLNDWQHTVALGWYIAGSAPLISTGIFIFTFFRIDSVVRATFRDLKTPGNSTPQNQASHAYTNWFASKGENTALATYVKNIEINMALSLAIVVPLWIFVFASNNAASEANKAKPHESVKPGLEIAIVDQHGALNKTSLSLLLDTLKLANNDKKAKYFVLSGTHHDKILYSSIINFVRAYLGSERVTELRLSEQLSPGESVIIKIEGLSAHETLHSQL